MASINTYPLDTIITAQDKVIGTDSSGAITKNFAIEDIAGYLNSSGSIESNGTRYKFKRTNLQSAGSFVLQIDGGSTVSFSSVDSIIISQQDLASRIVSSLYSSLVGSQVIIQSASNPSNFGVFNWSSSVQNSLDSNFFDISLEFVGGQNSLEADSDYFISLLRYGAPPFSPWNSVVGGINYPDGNVGIGTTSPSQSLDVVGSVIIRPLGTTDTISFLNLGSSQSRLVTTQDFAIVNGSSETAKFFNTGALKLGEYGSGTFTGTATQKLGVDASGNVIELPIGSGAVDGAGTANFVTKWIDTDTIGDSAIFDNGTSVGIGTTNPSARLHIVGNTGAALKTSGDISFTAYTGDTKIDMANNILQLLSPSGNVQIGDTESDGNGTSILVDDANSKIVIQGNVGIGTTSPSEKLDVSGDAKINGLTVGKGAGTSIYGNTVFGKTALESITTGLRNVAIANEAQLSNTTGNRNVAIGYQSLKDNIAGNNNTAIGYGSLMKVISKDKNTAVGYLSLGLVGGINSASTSDTGKNNTAIGYGAGYERVGGTNGNSIDSVFIGSLTKSNGLTSVNEIVIGTDAISAGSNTVVLGNDLITSTRLKGDVIVANGDIGIGTTNPSQRLHVAGNIRIENQLYDNTNSQGTNGQILSSTSAGTAWIDGSAITGVLSGSGPSNRTARWTGPNTLGVGALYDDSTNVGIGTASPAYKLDVNGTARVNGLLTIPGAIGHDGDVGTSIGFSGNDTIALSTNGSAKLEINALGQTAITGTLRVGTDLFNSLSIASGLTGTTYTTNANGLGSQPDIFFKTGVNTRLKINGVNGNVGIGTTSPAFKLDVENSSVSVARFKSTGTKAVIYLSEADEGGLISTEANRLCFGSGAGVSTVNMNYHMGTERLGIGTTSPTEKLDVIGNIKASGSIQAGANEGSPTAALVGSIRYKSDANNSYVDMVMQTDVTTYEWVNIVTNNW